MNTPVAVHAEALPNHAFGPRGLVWWGMIGFIVIETTMLAVVVASYFYLLARAPEWPIGRRLPTLGWPTANLGLMLFSLIPMYWTDRVTVTHDVVRVRRGLVACSLLGLIICALRPREFSALNVAWDDHAYGSLIWTLLGLHTAHLLAEVIETVIMTAFMFRRGPIHPKYIVDASDNALYWYFIVVAWVPLYVVIYVVPRLVE